MIRPLKTTDAKALIELHQAVDASGWMLFEPGERQVTLEQQQQMIERLTGDEKSTFLVAEIDGRLAGFIAALGNHLTRNQHAAYLVLGVREEYRGQGIATALLEQIFAWAETAAISRLELTVIKDNLNALHLYQKMGFAIEGEKIHSLMIDGQPVNEYYLYRLLDTQ